MKPFITLHNIHVIAIVLNRKAAFRRTIYHIARKVIIILTLAGVSCFSLSRLAMADTAVIVIKTATGILIGADSLSTTIGGKGTRKACKIIQAGNLYFASAGVVENPDHGYNARAIAAQAEQQPGTMLEKITAFENLVEPQLQQEVEWIRVKHPNIYRQDFDRAEKVTLEVLFAGIENNVLKVEMRQFRLTNRATEPVSFYIFPISCPGTCNNPQGWARPMGHFARMGPYVKDNFSISSDSIALINRGISLEFSGGKAGPPIDILEITKTGARWVQHKDQCPDIQNQATHKPTPKGNSPAKTKKKK